MLARARKIRQGHSPITLRADTASDNAVMNAKVRSISTVNVVFKRSTSIASDVLRETDTDSYHTRLQQFYSSLIAKFSAMHCDVFHKRDLIYLRIEICDVAVFVRSQSWVPV